MPTDLLDDEAWDAIVCPTLEQPGCVGYSEPLEVSPGDGRRLRADHRARIAQSQADAERIAALEDGERHMKHVIWAQQEKCNALEAERDRLRGIAVRLRDRLLRASDVEDLHNGACAFVMKGNSCNCGMHDLEDECKAVLGDD